MKNLRLFLAAAGVVVTGLTSQAQQVTDRFDMLLQKAAANNTNFEADLKSFNQSIAERIEAMQPAGSAAKATASRGTIPVIFHIVLDTGKMNQLGNVQEIEQRIKSQLEVLNTDFNALNSDASAIPGAFKPLYASLNVNFALAHTDPSGKYTKGYEIVYTTKKGFDENNLTVGSQFACSDAKFNISGGVDAWDTKKYYNVWVINILPAGIGGIGTPPPYALYGGTQLLPFNEQGTVISFMTLGKKENPTQYFPLPPAIAGRTLVHETGHFMNLFHTFGMSTFNNSNCQDDDGVTDTPPQVAPSQGKPNFPLLDGCSPATPGVMWMNHMDYSDDVNRVMFTAEQSGRMAIEFEPGGYRYELLQHPELLNAPLGISDAEKNNPMHIWPNPVSNTCHIVLDNGYNNGVLTLTNTMGQMLLKQTINGTDHVQVDMQKYPTGTYIVRYTSGANVYTEKIVKL
jgi:hypothetical protein